MKKSKTIVLWGREDLLSSSVEIFLTAQKGWHVVSISDEENFEALSKAVDKVNPEVIIIHQGDHPRNSDPLMKLIQAHPGLRVITVSLKDNLLEVYSKQNILVRSGLDLISAVEGDPLISNRQGNETNQLNERW